MRFVRLGAGAVLACVVFACTQPSDQGLSEPVGVSRSAVQDSVPHDPTFLDPDTVHKYAVGVIVGGGGICSGSLITPNLVVTARHCIDVVAEPVKCKDENPVFGPRQAASFQVTTNANIFGGSGKHAVKQIIIPPDNHVCSSDIALLVLNDLIGSAEAKPIIPGVQYPMTDKRYTGAFTVIGYGNTSVGGGDAGTRRSRQGILVRCMSDDPFAPCPAEFVNAFVSFEGVCKGDSGSGAFEQLSFEKGAPVSFGVLSLGGEEGDVCTGALYTRLDRFRDLVVNSANSASNNWTLYPKPSPDWTIYVPPANEDGGTTDSGSKPKPKGELGDPCVGNGDCKGALCGDPGDGARLCTKACTPEDAAGCPDGFECRTNLCFPKPGDPNNPAGAPGRKTTTTSGCNSGGAQGGRTRDFRWAAGLAVALGALFARRRRR